MDLTKFTDAELDWLIKNPGTLVEQQTLRRQTEAYHPVPRFLVECTVSATVVAPNLRTLLNTIAEQGWSVHTLLDKGGQGGEIIVRDFETSHVLAEL